MAGPRVLVIDADPEWRDRVVSALAGQGFVVVASDSGEAARSQLVTSDRPDVVVLEPALPDGTGVALLRELVSKWAVPVVALSERGDEADRVLGLELGAADYVVKPFFPRELAIRVRRAVLGPHPAPQRLVFGALTIDMAAAEVTVGDNRVVLLTAREFELLTHLATAPRRVFTREELLAAVWHSSSKWQSPRTVTEHIRRVRTKIEADPRRPRWVRTVSNVGYRFDP